MITNIAETIADQFSTTRTQLEELVKIPSVSASGFDPAEVPALLERLDRSPKIDGPAALMTHLANADDPHDGLTQIQCEHLRALDPASERTLSIGNSAGILAFPDSRTQWVRPGIMLCGSSHQGRRPQGRDCSDSGRTRSLPAAGPSRRSLAAFG